MGEPPAGSTETANVAPLRKRLTCASGTAKRASRVPSTATESGALVIYDVDAFLTQAEREELDRIEMVSE